MKKKCCGMCEFFTPLNEKIKDVGSCWRYPPIADNKPNQLDKPPMVSSEWWCGEFKQKKGK